MIKTLIDQHYKHIRRYRFLYGWLKDAYERAAASKRAKEWAQRGFRGAKLDICGGRNPWQPGEFLNVDIVPLPKVDLVFDITKPFPFESNVIAEIFSAATLEHLRKHHNFHVLQEFYRVLAPGGTLRVLTPDIEAIARGVLSGHDLDEIAQFMFGKFKSDDTEVYDLHKWMFPEEEMKQVLRDLGFVDVERIATEERLHNPDFNYTIRAVKPPSS